jgi:hypothetical protein
LLTAPRGESADARPHLVAEPAEQADAGAASAELNLRHCFAPDSPFARMAHDVARNAGLDARALSVRTLLHLPRVADSSGLMSSKQVADELVGAAAQLADDVNATRHLVSRGRFELRHLRFELIKPETAEPIISSLHYLRSVRPTSYFFALLDPYQGLPVSICSVSMLQWRRVAGRLNAQFGIAREQIWDISRVYSCDTAPVNAISYLLARVRTAMRLLESDAELFTTAVDPNLGFTGASYRAANWQQWITVRPRPYLYHNDTYVSPRQLRERFGTSTVAELQKRYPDERFEQSQAMLMDSMVFCWRIQKETEVIPPNLQRRLHR